VKKLSAAALFVLLVACSSVQLLEVISVAASDEWANHQAPKGQKTNSPVRERWVDVLI
jgi:hypothetical protein